MAFQDILKSNKRLIVVLHVIFPDSGESPVKHSVGQCKLAVENGADAVAVIASDCNITKKHLIETATQIKQQFPKLMVILNFLARTSEEMQLVPEIADGLWTDRGLDARGFQHDVEQAATIRASNRAGWGGKWFAGFFHKGGNLKLPSDDAELHALADQFLRLHSSVIPTTTGAGTGTPADVPSLARLHKAIGGRKPMAIASGVDLQNVYSFLPYIDFFFVATGIERPTTNPITQEFYASAGMPSTAAVDVGHLDAARVRALADAIHSFDSPRAQSLSHLRTSHD